MKIGRRMYAVNVHMWAKIGASRSGRLFAVHNRTFRQGRTDARTDKRTNEHTSYPHIHSSEGVKNDYDKLMNLKKKSLNWPCLVMVFDINL